MQIAGYNVAMKALTDLYCQSEGALAISCKLDAGTLAGHRLHEFPEELWIPPHKSDQTLWRLCTGYDFSSRQHTAAPQQIRFHT